MNEKKTAPSVARNRGPILEILSLYIKEEKGTLLEIGSGTGEHAIYFAPKFPKLSWVCSDQQENHEVIKAWIEEGNDKNIIGPKSLKIGEDDFPKMSFQYVFTANTLHIMSWKEVKTLIKLIGKRLRQDSLVFIYGPFNYNGEFTSDSNKQFNEWLKQRNPESGIRDFEKVKDLMAKAGLSLEFDHEMPANNRLLVFKRQKFR